MKAVMIHTLSDLKCEVHKYLSILSCRVTQDHLPRTFDGRVIPFDKLAFVTFDSPTGDGTPFIEESHGSFFIVISERGNEFERVALTPDELLYRIFESITFSLATNFTSRNRPAAQDQRRLLFSKQLELLASLSGSWLDLAKQKQENILKQHPFIDL